MAAGVAGNALGHYVNGAPRVGHIIAFEPSPNGEADIATRLVVHRADHAECVLDLNTMRRSGGSLVVESQVAGEAAGFHTHWAGQRTSDDTGDCGSDAELIVRRQDLDLLGSFAGGYGAGPDREAIYRLSILN